MMINMLRRENIGLIGFLFWIYADLAYFYSMLTFHCYHDSTIINMSIAAFPMHDWLTVCSYDDEDNVLGPANLNS